MMTVNQLSKHGDVTPHVVRYYARIGLLDPIRHPENGYKLFSRDDAERLRFIRAAQALGYTLDEIGRILRIRDGGESPCATVRTMLARRIAENRRKLEELRALQQRMEWALARWERLPDEADGCGRFCHLIESVTDVRHDA
ncbi:MAG TPA: MerR family transcriptional regulator [Acidiferrobacterales bacterium]|jgi:DNA-binding transcriptional MerR regulator